MELSKMEVREPCIYRVPPEIRNVKPEAYTPRMVVIGPLHRSPNSTAMDGAGTSSNPWRLEKKYIKMEYTKKKYFESFTQRVGEATIEKMREIIQAEETNIRASYEEPAEWISSEYYVELILLDSVFIMEFFLKFRDRIHSARREISEQDFYTFPDKVVAQDLILLENQLPYFLFNRLFSSSVDVLYGRETLEELEWVFFGLNIEGRTNIKHFTDMLRRDFAETLDDDIPKDMKKWPSIRDLRNAENLSKKEVDFKLYSPAPTVRMVGREERPVRKSVVGRSLHVKFENGSLTMPAFFRDEVFDMHLRNVIAFEQCHDAVVPLTSNYIHFLNFIITSDRDSQLLIKKGVVMNNRGPPTNMNMGPPSNMNMGPPTNMNMGPPTNMNMCPSSNMNMDPSSNMNMGRPTNMNMGLPTNMNMVPPWLRNMNMGRPNKKCFVVDMVNKLQVGVKVGKHSQYHRVAMDLMKLWKMEPCIYRVPSRIRNVKPEAYTPQMVVIGPLHRSPKSPAKDGAETSSNHFPWHLKREHAMMEEEKERYLESFTARVGKYTIVEMRKIIKTEEENIRDSYEEPAKWIASEDYVKLILLDSVFILEFLLKHRENSDDKAVTNDLILLENQLPYFILDSLFSCSEKELYSRGTLDELILRFFGLTIEEKTNFKHLTDIFRCVYEESLGNIPRQMKHMDWPRIADLRNADALSQAGVDFKSSLCSVEGRSLHVKFEKRCLTIPGFFADEVSDMYLRNVIAFEHCHRAVIPFTSNYIHFLNFLITSNRDAQLLSEAGVVMGRPSFVLEMVTKLQDGVKVGYNSQYHLVANNLKAHYKSRRKMCWATLSKVYFKDLWTGTATVAAVFLLILTLVGTAASVIQAYKSFK